MTEDPSGRLGPLEARLRRLETRTIVQEEALRRAEQEIWRLRDATDGRATQDRRAPREPPWADYLLLVSAFLVTFTAAAWVLGAPEYARALSERLRVETEAARIALRLDAAPALAVSTAPTRAPPTPGEALPAQGSPAPPAPSPVAAFLYRFVIPTALGLVLVAGALLLSVGLLRNLFDRYGRTFFRSRAEGLRMLTASSSLVSMTFAAIRYWRNIGDNMAIQHVFYSGFAALAFAVVFAMTGSPVWALAAYAFLMGAVVFVSYIAQGAPLAFWEEYLRFLADSTGPEGTLLFLGMVTPIVLVAVTFGASVLRRDATTPARP